MANVGASVRVTDPQAGKTGFQKSGCVGTFHFATPCAMFDGMSTVGKQLAVTRVPKFRM